MTKTIWLLELWEQDAWRPMLDRVWSTRNAAAAARREWEYYNAPDKVRVAGYARRTP